MGEVEVPTGVVGAVENGKTLPEKEGEVMTERKEEKDGVKEMETDGKEDETKTEAIEEEMGEKLNEGSEEKVSKKENLEEVKEGKGSKKRQKTKIVDEMVEEKKAVKEKKEKEKKTPVASTIERPVRERKSVERLVASFEIEAVKEFHIAKGQGTALKDIPNVAYKLSKRKTDDTLKLLHTILFGRRGKASQIKNNISRFSGFVRNENEEKEKKKFKEKLDKCVKEKLLDICDMLDIPIPKATTKKEDIIAKLVEFLVAPHATTTELLSEKEQSSKGKKRKRVSKGSGDTSSKCLAKSRKGVEDSSKGKEKKELEEAHEQPEKEEEEEETVNGVPEISDDETPERNETEEKDMKKRKRGSKNRSTKKVSIEKPKTKKITSPKKSSPVPKRTPVKSSSGSSKLKDNSYTSPKSSSRKKKNEVEIKKSKTPKKSAPKEKTGKKVVKANKKPKEDKTSPSDDELKNTICKILKEVDFNTVTFNDILKQLGKQFNTDLTPRKSSIKVMIQDELTKLADEGDNEEDED